MRNRIVFPKNISRASPLGLATKNNCGGHTAPKPPEEIDEELRS